MQIIIIGGGAAGFFAAANIPRGHNITILEKTNKLLSKVLISGGGRCNVTHSAFELNELLPCYPRGNKDLRPGFKTFMPVDTIAWFEARGVKLHTEADGRMFPTTNRSQTIADALYNAAIENGAIVKQNTGVEAIIPHPEGGYTLSLEDGSTLYGHKVICAMGGHSMARHYSIFDDLIAEVIPPVASLFTFNTIDKSTSTLMGLAVPNATISIQGLKDKSTGPVLFTHWGFSGPAVLRLSALAARYLKEREYRYIININWTNAPHQDALYKQLIDIKAENMRTLVKNMDLFELPKRLWLHFLEVTKTPLDIPFSELSHKHLASLSQKLADDTYPCQGKTTFKDEFVTSGGISMKEINLDNMEHKTHKGLYFVGEVLNVDGITGGFNFQAAWTTAWLAAKDISEQI